MKSFLNKNIATSRGIRNNNPGNFRKTTIPWKGKVPHGQNTDGAFEQFVSIAWGIRAIIVDVQNKIKRGLNTIAKILAVYAPAFENDTNAYINRVSSLSSIGKNQVLQPTKNTLFRIVSAIITVENRAEERHLISDKDIEKAFGLVNANFKVIAGGTTKTIGILAALYGLYKYYTSRKNV
ncbi:MAG: hypothetical protein AAGI07_00260 [Bacteroidota bacterium]